MASMPDLVVKVKLDADDAIVVLTELRKAAEAMKAAAAAVERSLTLETP